MKVIWTLKNSPKPHIQAKATEFPHNSAFIQRKFINDSRNPHSRHRASWILPKFAANPAVGLRNGPTGCESGENYH
jgi:hypothetical protein